MPAWSGEWPLAIECSRVNVFSLDIHIEYTVLVTSPQLFRRVPNEADGLKMTGKTLLGMR
jgi:hypothetical protein